MTLGPQFQEQLALFMPARELKRQITHSFDRLGEDTFVKGKWKVGKESMDEMWARKERESRQPRASEDEDWSRAPTRITDHGAGVYDSIKEKGFDFSHPVDVDHFDSPEHWNSKVVGDGHHRIAAAAALEEETGKDVYVPIEHYRGASAYIQFIL